MWLDIVVFMEETDLNYTFDPLSKKSKICSKGKTTKILMWRAPPRGGEYG